MTKVCWCSCRDELDEFIEAQRDPHLDGSLWRDFKKGGPLEWFTERRILAEIPSLAELELAARADPDTPRWDQGLVTESMDWVVRSRDTPSLASLATS